MGGTYTQNRSAALAIELGSSSSDRLTVNGDVRLNGTLNVSFPSPYEPAANTSFTVLSWTGSRLNNTTFSSVNLPGLTTTGNYWTLAYQANALVLTVKAGTLQIDGVDIVRPASGNVKEYELLELRVRISNLAANTKPYETDPASYEKKEHAECGGKYIRNEFTHESFERSFSIPDCVDDKSISSSCKDGVLSVVLPFAEGSKLSRTVPVN